MVITRTPPGYLTSGQAPRAVIADQRLAGIIRSACLEHALNAVSGYLGASDDAILASILDQDVRNRLALIMLERALDQRELKFSRGNDLDWLFCIARAISRLDLGQCAVGRSMAQALEVTGAPPTVEAQ